MKNRNRVGGTARSNFVSAERPDRLGAHSAGTPGVKRPGREVENVARHLAVVKNEHLCSNTHRHGGVLNKAEEGLFVRFDTGTLRQDGIDRT
jgi:hypothetical protein